MHRPLASRLFKTRTRRTVRSFRSKSVFETLESRCCLAAEFTGMPSEFEASAESSSVMLSQPVLDDTIVDPLLDDALIGAPLGDIPIVDIPMIDAPLLDIALIDEYWEDSPDLQSGNASEALDCAATVEANDLVLDKTACIVDSSPLIPGATSSEATFSVDGTSTPTIPLLPNEQTDGNELPGIGVPTDPPATDFAPIDEAVDSRASTTPPTDSLVPTGPDNESAKEQSIDTRPQIWPAPQITVTATTPLSSRSMETTPVPLRDIADFLTNNRARGISAVTVSKRDPAMVKTERLSTSLPKDSDILASAGRMTKSQGAVSPTQLKPRLVGVNPLMPVVSVIPRQPVSNDATARTDDTIPTVRKTSDSRIFDSASTASTAILDDGAVELVNVSASIASSNPTRPAAYLLAILPERVDVDETMPADETAVHQRPNTVLGIAIATVFGLPHAFIKPWLIRQRDRVTTKQNLDQYL